MRQIQAILCVVALAAAFAAAASHDDDVLVSVSRWMASNQPAAKASARRGLESSDLPGLDDPVSEHMSADTLRRLMTPQSLQVSLRNSSRMALGPETMSAAFGQLKFDLGQGSKLSSEILDLVSEEVRVLARRPESTTMRQMMEALLVAQVDVLELGLEELFVQLAFGLAEVAAGLHPVPEYLDSDDVFEGDGSTPVRYHDIVQDNWGGTLESSETVRTFYPETRGGVVSVVKKAAAEGARVRVSGIKHTWNHWMWGVDTPVEEADDGGGSDGAVDYYIAMVPYEVSDHLYFVRDGIDDWQRRADELTSITGPIDEWEDEEDGSRHASVRVGAAALNQFLFDWSLDNGEWALPSDTLMLLMTYGGSTSMVCHGGGLRHGSVSDLILEVEYVDADGEIQVVDDPEELRVAAGAFGLLGVLLSVTFSMDEMTYASWQPVVVEGPAEDYFTRPGEDLPAGLVSMLEDHYYAEWFAYPSHHLPDGQEGTLWQNVWKNDGAGADAAELINQLDSDLQTSYEYLADVGNKVLKVVLETLDADEYAYWVWGFITGETAKLVTVDLDEPFVTTVPEALHYQRGLHAIVVKAMEFNIPIADDGDGNPDWSTLQDSWWLVQDLIKSYEDQGMYPVDTVVEMRLLGSSDLLLAPYFGNDFGTVSIEVCSSPIVPFDLWEEFKADLAAEFQEYGDGKLRKPRPHWAKEFPVGAAGQSSLEFALDVFGDQVGDFVAAHAALVQSRGGDASDTLARFGTRFLDQLVAVASDADSEESPVGGNGAPTGRRPGVMVVLLLGCATTLLAVI